MTPKDFTLVETPSETPQQVPMIQNFADLVASGDRQICDGFAVAAKTTQHYLDLVWATIAER